MTTLDAYKKFRRSNCRAVNALSMAKTLTLWNELQSQFPNRLEIKAIPDEHGSECPDYESFCNTQTEANKLIKQWESIMEDGDCYGVVTYVDGDEVDSVWGNDGYNHDAANPFKNYYVADLMDSAINQLVGQLLEDVAF